MLLSETTVLDAAQHLSTRDPLLKSVIEKYGPCTIRPHTDYYQELVDSIVSQQLSVKAAAAIEGRFRDMFGGQFPSPQQILTKTPDDLRAIGFSYAKGNYVRDLAQHIIDGEVQFDKFDALSNEEIISELTAVKGIGEWTAHMFLMFCMGRSDVLPVGDLGIKNGIKKLYSLDEAPSPEQIKAIARNNQWQPYESVACWYIWASLDNKPAV